MVQYRQRKDGGTMDTTNQAAWETLTPGGKAQGSLQPAGGHPENLPRTRRDHAGVTRQESARPDREDGIFNSQKKQRI